MVSGSLLGRVRAEARRVSLPAMLLTGVAAVLWAAGWALSRLVLLVAAGAAWSVAAVRVGWSDARRGR